MRPRTLAPAFLGGCFIGVLSALPVVSLGNACCCLWLVAGGGIAAWIMQQGHPHPVSLADGARVGFLAGLLGAVVYLVVSWPVTLVVGPWMDEWMDRALESAGDVPLRDVFERYRVGGARAVTVAVGFVVQLVLGMIFSTAGGVLGAMIFRRPQPTAPPSLPSAGPWSPSPPLVPPPSSENDRTGPA
jgi:hypothetical protein